MAAGVTIAVVAVCRDQGRALPACLDALAAQEPAPVATVVVDDGSVDLYTRQALAALRRPGVSVVRVPRGGTGAALNAGVARVATPYVVALEALDCLPAGWFAAAHAALARDATAGVVVPGALAALDAATLLARGADVRALVVNRRRWEDAGRFAEDPALAGLELADFTLALLTSGVPCVTAPAPPIRGLRRPPCTVSAHRCLRERHAGAAAALGLDLVLAKEAWLVDVRERHAALERGCAAEERALTDIRREIDDLVGALARAGRERVDWGDLRRVVPLSSVWGIDRGRPMDRYFIERFLERHRADVRGRVLEVRDPAYTRIFGGDAVTESAVLDIDPANPDVTVVADLRHADAIPAERFDCFILTQTLHIMDDPGAALREAYRILAPGGVLLGTLPAVGRINNENGGLDGGDHWRFTEASVRTLFAAVFPPEAFTVEVTGNVLVTAAFLYGMAPHELTAAELDHVDPWQPLLFCVRAVKPQHRATPAAAAPGEAVVLLYHRVAAVDGDAATLAISPDTFRTQMEHLHREWQPMGLAELVAAASAGTVPERAVAVTFDDGYLDALTSVSPILTSLDIPATFFVIADALDGDGEFWWDVLERVLLGPHALPDAVEVVLDGAATRLPTRTAATRMAAWRRIRDWMVRASADARDTQLAAIARWSGQSSAPRESHRPMRRAELRALAARPRHAVGAHGARHLLLPAQPLADAIQEVVDARTRLHEVLGTAVASFAYPYGGHDATAVEIVRAARFDLAVTAEARPLRPGDDPLRVPRLDPSRLDLEAFRARLAQLKASAR